MKTFSKVIKSILHVFNVNQVYNQKFMFYITKDFHNLKKQNMVCALL